MLTELYFVSGILCFALIALFMAVEDFVAAHFFSRDSLAHHSFNRFEKNHPTLCDRKDLVYSFFKKDALHLK